ncbi:MULTISPECIES: carbohydrate-binding protein [Zobellia]|uniref:Glycoside hydrolase, family GH16 n=1 Tax=Zobellia galactanivorans (strain DSM 12802 / CCUG 47099 / CIP 106680 / NCIMB 13871 / Dsij) TaxID=63186 RepID=G0L2M6_ZOBGA|nr:MULTISPECIES: carbohydrate-binding protein [Zobellia]OWW26162.1 hypothetical protein B4Q04_00315 [Zobellia sp. OII3]CAZ95078.1 Glycoside hydrolase, family GH16 [Zobellia galactanivorans]
MEKFQLFRNLIILTIICNLHWGQAQDVIMFDDFNYDGINDDDLSNFNKWVVVDGLNGPPANAIYNKGNVKFVQDPDLSGNALVTLETVVNKQGSGTDITHSRIQTNGYDYFEGTYSARVNFSDVPFAYKDGNVQTFYTIVSHLLATDGSRYSEIDFEYFAADKWGTSTDNQVLYTTAYNRYEGDNFFNDSDSSTRSYSGWHTYTFSFTDGVNVKFWVDDEYLGVLKYSPKDGSPLYPRSPMQIAFANWIFGHITGASTENRNSTMKVDWVLFYENEEVAPSEIENLVSEFRSNGIQRRNLAGEVFPEGGGEPIFEMVMEAEDYTNMGGVEVENTTDTNGGQNVGYIDAEDWMSYADVTFPISGDYTVSYRVASRDGGGSLSLDLNAGSIVLGERSIPKTDGWQNWTTVSHTVHVDAGTYNLGIYAITGGWNINWLKISMANTNNLNASASIFPESSLEIDSLDATVSPNSFRDNLSVDLGSSESASAIVLDVTGQQVASFEKVMNHEFIDLSELEPGLYFLRLKTDTYDVVKSILKE